MIEFVFWTLFWATIIITSAAIIKGRRDRVKMLRARREQAARDASYAAHPAGTKLAYRPPLERTRHLDRAGTDWTVVD